MTKYTVPNHTNTTGTQPFIHDEQKSKLHEILFHSKFIHQQLEELLNSSLYGTKIILHTVPYEENNPNKVVYTAYTEEYALLYRIEVTIDISDNLRVISYGGSYIVNVFDNDKKVFSFDLFKLHTTNIVRIKYGLRSLISSKIESHNSSITKSLLTTIFGGEIVPKTYHFPLINVKMDISYNRDYGAINFKLINTENDECIMENMIAQDFEIVLSVISYLQEATASNSLIALLKNYRKLLGLSKKEFAQKLESTNVFTAYDLFLSENNPIDILYCMYTKSTSCGKNLSYSVMTPVKDKITLVNQQVIRKKTEMIYSNVDSEDMVGENKLSQGINTIITEDVLSVEDIESLIPHLQYCREK